MVGVFEAIKKGFGIAAKSLGLVLILIIFNLIGNLASMPFAVAPGQTPTPQAIMGAVIFTLVFVLVSIFIQEASKAALDKKINLEDIFRLVRSVRKTAVVPICLMTYYNPVFCYGEARFVKDAVAAGVDGVIIPDLPPEEAVGFIQQAALKNLDTIFLAAPTSTAQRLKLISKVSRGFIYYVSLTGVTGPRASLPMDLGRQIKIIKKITSKPVCVGFGVSRRQQVEKLNKISDGVIVGSAIVRKIKENISRPDLVKKVSGFISCLKGA